MCQMQNAFVRFQMKAYLFYHAQQALSRTFLTFFEAFQLQTSFSQFFRNFLSRFAILPDSLFIIPHPDSLVNIFFHPLSSFFCPRRRPSRCSLISIRHSHPLVNSFFRFFRFLSGIEKGGLHGRPPLFQACVKSKQTYALPLQPRTWISLWVTMSLTA